MDLIQHAHKRRAEKRARLLFAYDDVAALRRDLGDDFVSFIPSFGHVFGRAAVLGLPAPEGDGVRSVIMTGGVKCRQMFFARFGKQLADMMDAFPALGAATIAKAFDRIENRLG